MPPLASLARANVASLRPLLRPHVRVSVPRHPSLPGVGSPFSMPIPSPASSARAFHLPPRAGPLRRNSFFSRNPSFTPRQSRSLFSSPFFFPPKFGTNLFVRIPLALGGMAAGGAAYMGQKMEEFGSNFSWIKDGVGSARDSARDFLKRLDENRASGRKRAGETEEEAARRNAEEQAKAKEKAGAGKDQKKPDEEEDPSAAPAALAAAAALEAEERERERTRKRREEDEAEKAREAAAKEAEEAKRRSRMRNTANRSDDEFSELTRKLIEIRNILKTVDTTGGADDGLHLPSIVVIGSQSSGKSSVLETLVGREFLPKGNNMVTRRPIELTLIYTPDSDEEYAEFPQLGFGKVKDFTKVQRNLADLNAAVPDHEVVSDNPIELRIYSPNVPDLTLVDLPGYIAITNRRQPAELKQKIADLCDKYISRDNVILAVSAADVDLANSEALRASRKADPFGQRTIGVLTKMDLVEPAYGAQMLRTTDYALQLGYVGVVCKPPAAAPHASRPGGGGQHGPGRDRDRDHNSVVVPAGGSSGGAVMRANDDFFRKDPAFSGRDINVGMVALRRKLISVLEQTMSGALVTVADAVERELEEANYQFKVQYNDQRVSAESYVADSIDGIKQRFKGFVAEFGKPEVREAVRKTLQRRVLDVCNTVYYQEPAVVSDFPRSCAADPASPAAAAWAAKVEMGSSALTKSGVGRVTTQLIVDLLQRTVEDITSVEPFVYHPEARKKVLDFSANLVRSKFHSTVDQVENNIKPYKYEVDVTQAEWSAAVARAVESLEEQLKEKTTLLQGIKSQVGRRRLRMAMSHLETHNRIERAKAEARRQQGAPLATAAAAPPAPPSPSWWQRVTGGGRAPPPPPSASLGPDAVDEPAPAPVEQPEQRLSDSPRINPVLLEKAREAASLRQQTIVLKSRIAVLRSGACASVEAKTCCPEVFYTAIAEKLTTSAAMFLQVELLNEFFFAFPREVDNRLYYDLSRDEILEFAKQNPQVRRHLELQERKEKLESVMEKLIYLQRKQDKSRYY